VNHACKNLPFPETGDFIQVTGVMEKRLMDVKEAATYLGMSESALYKKVWKRQVPFAVKIGRSLRFDKVRMNEWIEDNFLKTEKYLNH